MKKVIAGLFAILICASFLHAHSGGTNSQGCHTNHQNGSYHCH